MNQPRGLSWSLSKHHRQNITTQQIIKLSINMSSKKILGGVAAVGAGYFGYTLYKSGGNVKVAEKQVESMSKDPDSIFSLTSEADYAKAEAKIKSELPGREKQIQKQAETMVSWLAWKC